MKKTLFALLACATLAAPATAKDWSFYNTYMGVYNNDRTFDHYKMYIFYQETTDITTTIQNNTLADFKTTYGEGSSCVDDWGDQLEFDTYDFVVTSPTDDYSNIWGVVVYENGDDSLFSVAPFLTQEGNHLIIDFFDGNNSYVAFNPGSPATPEPATATLSLLALAGLASRRRRK